jgi:hypothetical protein
MAQVKTSPAISNEEFKRVLLGYPKARHDLRTLTSKGASEEILIGWLRGVARLERLTQGRPKPLKLGGWPLPKVRRFAKRIQKMEKEIRQFNLALARDPLVLLIIEMLEPTKEGASRERQGPQSRISDPLLPSLVMENYVTLLQRLQRFGVLAMQHTGRQLQSYRDRLVLYVQSVTGSSHYDEVANLITAAYQAVGLDRSLEPHTLEVAVSRLSPKPILPPVLEGLRLFKRLSK